MSNLTRLKQIYSNFRYQLSKWRLNLSHPYFDRFTPTEWKARWNLQRYLTQRKFFHHFFFVGWTRPTGVEVTQPKENFFWPLYVNPRYNNELFKFMKSERHDGSKIRNINNLMFIVGPRGSGKSWFLNYNIQRLQKTANPILFHINLQDHSHLNFDTFLEFYESKIIDTIVERADDTFEQTQLLNCNVALDVFLHSRERLNQEFKLATLLQMSLKGEGWLQIDESIKDELYDILQLHKERKYKTTPLFDSWQQLCTTLGKQYSYNSDNKNEVKASLEICKALSIAAECDHDYSELNRSGLAANEFLFDYCDLIAGYHDLNNPDRTEYPTVLLVFEEFQKIAERLGNELKVINFIDQMMLRLYHDNGWRNHFPVIIETNMNRYFTSEIYDELQVYETAFPTLEFFGIEKQEDMKNFFGHIYNEVQQEILYTNVGRNLNHLRTFTNSLIDSTEDEPNITDHVSCTKPEFDKEYNIFKHKIYSLYTRPDLEHLLDSGDIDFAILDLIESFTQCKGEIYAVDCIGTEFKGNSLVRALVEENLLYQEKHYSYVNVGSQVYLQFFRRWVKDKKAALTRVQRLDYKYYRITKGFHIRDMAIYKDRMDYTRFNDHKHYSNWDTDLYGNEYGPRPDPVTPGYPLYHPGTRYIKYNPWGIGGAWGLYYHVVMPGVLVAQMYGYPDKYMNKPKEYILEDKRGVAPTTNVHQYLTEMRLQPSNLPQYPAEAKTNFNEQELYRAHWKLLYIYEHPELYNKGPIQWKDVRRWKASVEKSVDKYGLKSLRG